MMRCCLSYEKYVIYMKDIIENLRLAVRKIAAVINRQITLMTTNAIPKPFQFCFLLVPPTNSYKNDK